MASNTVTVTIDARPAIDAIAEAQELIRSHAALRAEVESLRHTKEAFDEWIAKTDWVQKSAAVNELGKHRADVLWDRIEALRAALKPFAAIDLTTNQAVDAIDVLRARRALNGDKP